MLVLSRFSVLCSPLIPRVLPCFYSPLLIVHHRYFYQNECGQKSTWMLSSITKINKSFFVWDSVVYPLTFCSFCLSIQELLLSEAALGSEFSVLLVNMLDGLLRDFLVGPCSFPATLFSHYFFLILAGKYSSSNCSVFLIPFSWLLEEETLTWVA